MRDKEAKALGIPVNKREVPKGKEGDKCGIVRGKGQPCVIRLNSRGECRLHCRTPTRNTMALSDLCPQYRMKGSSGCRKHGGKAAKGALAPGFKDGRWSKYAPKRYAGLVAAVAAGDPLDLHDDIHMVSARIAELLNHIDEEGNPDFVKRVKVLTSRLIKALGPVATNEGMAILGELESTVKSAAKDFTLWSEVSDLFGQRVKMVESQRKRDLEGGRYVTADDMIALVNAMGSALKRKLEARLPKAEADSLLIDIGVEFAAIQGIGTTEIIDGGVV